MVCGMKLCSAFVEVCEPFGVGGDVFVVVGGCGW